MTKPSKRFKAFGIDDEGKKTSHGNEEKMAVRDDEIFEKGELVAVVSRLGEEFAIKIMGPPNIKTLEYLQTVARAYEKILNHLGIKTK